MKKDFVSILDISRDELGELIATACRLKEERRVGVFPPHLSQKTLGIRITSYNVCYTKLLRQIIERAKALLLEFEEPGIDPDSLIDAVRESQRIEKIETIGQDNAPAGPNVLQSDAIIVVEGRADVINLLRAGIKNAIAVEGTSVPATIINMCHKRNNFV